ncbi:hypothetical protein MAR_038367 [Mya arenaria]|uniref:Uncharacterized protein n=1 Tax=Mya arenaria TaxID=6604 RepID=A0ABY7FV24_MYAAR|nr:hypothetical protein MAR_038367 [Mya arenaria]
MKKTTFAVEMDSSGREYVGLVMNDVDSTSDDTIGEARMYARPGDDMCPVKSFKRYPSGLHPDLGDQWQRSHGSFNTTDDCWFCKYPLWKNLYLNETSRKSEPTATTWGKVAIRRQPSLAHDTLADNTLADDSLADETLTDDALADDTLADDILASDAEADDTLADDSQTDVTLADDTLADDTIADDALAYDTLADNALRDSSRRHPSRRHSSRQHPSRRHSSR